jgi:hypothetical protein
MEEGRGEKMKEEGRRKWRKKEINGVEKVRERHAKWEGKKVRTRMVKRGREGL